MKKSKRNPDPVSLNGTLVRRPIQRCFPVFILPTLEDNLPNTMVESLCCGTPVISFSNGGMTDYIKTMKNGILVKEPNSKELLHAINTFLDNINTFDDRETISKENHKIFAPQLQAERYIEFFKSILKERH